MEIKTYPNAAGLPAAPRMRLPQPRRGTPAAAWALLLVEEEGLTVIDFKSDRIAPGTEAQAALRHKLQVDIYAQAAQKIFGLPVREKLVFFLRTGRGQPV